MDRSLKIIIILVILIGLYFLFINLRPTSPETQRDEVNVPSVTQSQMIENTTPPSLPMDWETFSTSGISLTHPSEAITEVENDGLLVRFMGQKQIDSGRTQTELFDGYILRVETILAEPADTLDTLSETERTNAETNCQSETGNVTQLQSVDIDSQNAFQFTATGCYIDYTTTIAEVNDKFYRISQSYVGTPEDQEMYHTITDQMVDSLTFEN